MGQCIPFIPYDVFYYVGITGLVTVISTFLYTYFEKHQANVNEKIKKIGTRKIDPVYDVPVVKTRLEKLLSGFNLKFWLVFLISCLLLQILFTGIYWLGLRWSRPTVPFWYSCTADVLTYIGLIPAVISICILSYVIIMIISVLLHSTKE